MKKIKNALITFLFFFFIYEVRFKSIPTIFSSRKVTLVILIILSFIKYRKESGIVFSFSKLNYGIDAVYKNYLLGIIIVWAYSFFLAIANNRMGEGYVDIKFLFFYLLYSVIAPYFLCHLFSNVEDLFRTLSFAGIVQATVVYLLAVSYDLRVILDKYLATETNVSYSMQTVKVYGLGAWGANGSVLLFLSMYAIGYLLLKNKQVFFHLIMYVYILVATMMVGRTGFYFGVMFGMLLIFMSMNANVKRSILVKITGSFSLLLLFVVIGLSIIPNNINVYERAMTTISHMDMSTIFDRNGPSFINSMIDMSFPDLSIELIYGSGHGRGISKTGIDVQNDIGYVQRFYALGLIMALTLYVVIFKTFFKVGKRIKEKRDKRYFYFLIFTLMILEFKEQFVYYYIVPAIILTIGLVHIRSQDKAELLSDSHSQLNYIRYNKELLREE